MKFTEMKYFESHNPYYSLIKAETLEKAKEFYTTNIGEDDGELDIKEVNRDYALVRFSKSPGEDGTEISVKEILEEFKGPEEKCLLVDGDLL